MKSLLTLLVVSVLFLGLVSVLSLNLVSTVDAQEVICKDLDNNNSIISLDDQAKISSGLDCNNDGQIDKLFTDKCLENEKLREYYIYLNNEGGNFDLTDPATDTAVESGIDHVFVDIDCAQRFGENAFCSTGRCVIPSPENVVIDGIERKVFCKDPDNTIFWLDKNDTERINNGDLGQETTAYLYYEVGSNKTEYKVPDEYGHPIKETDSCDEGNAFSTIKDKVNEWYCNDTKKGLEQLQQEEFPTICPNECKIIRKSLISGNEKPSEKIGACAKVQIGTGDGREGPVITIPEAGISCTEDDETDSPYFKAYENPLVWLKGKNKWEPGTTKGKDKKTHDVVSRNDFCLKFRDYDNETWRYELYENYCELNRKGEKTDFVKTDPILCSPRYVCGDCTPTQWEDYDNLREWFRSIYGNEFSFTKDQYDVEICKQGRSYCAPQGTKGEMTTAPKSDLQGNCYDVDGENKYRAGWADDVNGRQIDSCLDENNVQEKVCLGTFITTKKLKCENGCFSFKVTGGKLGEGGNIGKYAGRCLASNEVSEGQVFVAPKSGVAVVPDGQCIDADEGLDEPLNGRWAKSVQNGKETLEFDSCKKSRSKVILLEKHCKNGNVITEEVNCAQEYAGVCVKSEQEEGAKCFSFANSPEKNAEKVQRGKTFFCRDRDGENIFKGTYAIDYGGALPDRCVVDENGKTGEILEAICKNEPFQNGRRQAVYEKKACPDFCVDEDGLAYCTGENPGYSLNGEGERTETVYSPDREIKDNIRTVCRDYDEGAKLLQSSCAEKTVFVNGQLDPTKSVEKFDVCLPGSSLWGKDIPAITKSAVCAPNGEVGSVYVLCDSYLCSADGRSCNTGGKIVEKGELDDIGKNLGGFTRLISKATLELRIQQLDQLEKRTEKLNVGNCPADGEGNVVTVPKAGVDYSESYGESEDPAAPQITNVHDTIISCTDSDSNKGDLNEQKFFSGKATDSQGEYVDVCNKDDPYDGSEFWWTKIPSNTKKKTLWEAVCADGVSEYRAIKCNDRCIGPDDFGGKKYAYCGQTLSEAIKRHISGGKYIIAATKLPVKIIRLPIDAIGWAWRKIFGSD